jgi:hypothetical protein
MAKAKGATSTKITFGSRKGGKPAKSKNKHTPKQSKYRGQGR